MPSEPNMESPQIVGGPAERNASHGAGWAWRPLGRLLCKAWPCGLGGPIRFRARSDSWRRPSIGSSRPTSRSDGWDGQTRSPRQFYGCAATVVTVSVLRGSGRRRAPQRRVRRDSNHLRVGDFRATSWSARVPRSLAHLRRGVGIGNGVASIPGFWRPCHLPK